MFHVKHTSLQPGYASRCYLLTGVSRLVRDFERWQVAIINGAAAGR